MRSRKRWKGREITVSQSHCEDKIEKRAIRRIDDIVRRINKFYKEESNERKRRRTKTAKSRRSEG